MVFPRPRVVVTHPASFNAVANVVNIYSLSLSLSSKEGVCRSLLKFFSSRGAVFVNCGVLGLGLGFEDTSLTLTLADTNTTRNILNVVRFEDEDE